MAGRVSLQSYSIKLCGNHNIFLLVVIPSGIESIIGYHTPLTIVQFLSIISKKLKTHLFQSKEAWETKSVRF